MEVVKSTLLPGQTGRSGGSEAFDRRSTWPLWGNSKRGAPEVGGIPSRGVGQRHLGGLLLAEGTSVSGRRAVHRTGERDGRGIGQGPTSEVGLFRNRREPGL